jgi:hypothetical protein
VLLGSLLAAGPLMVQGCWHLLLAKESAAALLGQVKALQCSWEQPAWQMVVRLFSM